MPEYDDIAADYAASKQLPYRIAVEAPTLFALAGDVRGKTILDLPCGDGTYARAFARRGAASVLGVDLSSGMVERARMSEREAPLGIRYQVGHAASLGTLGALIWSSPALCSTTPERPPNSWRSRAPSRRT
jgi:2-polyprenyl-3-methyl-5-hydroxy-6-metoxy-1,4-benzoquinol methylase